MIISSSAIFSWKMKIPTGNKFIFFCGKPNVNDTKMIERPVFIVFQVTKSGITLENKQDRDSHRKLRIFFYQSPLKTLVDRATIDANEILSGISPLAVKIYDLPDNISESL